MKTLSEHIKESQLVANIVRSEVSRGNSVFLVVNQRTGGTLVASNPVVYGGKRNNGINSIDANDPNYRYGDIYGLPVDQIDSIDQLDRPFAMVEEPAFAIADKTANTGRELIAEDDSNTSLEENARKFQTAQDAEMYIIEKGWQDWAVVIKL